MTFRSLFPTFLFDADDGAGSGGTATTDPPADPPAGTDPPATDPPAGDAGDGKPAPTQADIDKAYAKLRAAEKERDTLKAEAEKRAEAEMSELDKANKRAADAEAAIATSTAKVRRANLVAGLSNPAREIAPDALDLVAGAIEVEYDDDDNPIGLQAAVESFLADRPSLKARAGGPTTSPGNPDAARRKAGEISKAEAIELAKTNPTRFNELFEKGEIPGSALSGD